MSNTILKRGVYKGDESTPPMKYMSVPQRIAAYLNYAGLCLSYPTYVLFNLNNLRKKPEYQLGDHALAEKQCRITLKH